MSKLHTDVSNINKSFIFVPDTSYVKNEIHDHMEKINVCERLERSLIKYRFKEICSGYIFIQMMYLKEIWNSYVKQVCNKSSQTECKHCHANNIVCKPKVSKYFALKSSSIICNILTKYLLIALKIVRKK